MFDIKRQKDAIREVYKPKREAIPADVKAELDRKIFDTFTSLATYRYASVLLLYYPKPDEVNILPIAEKALQDGKKVAFPRCMPDIHDMNYHFITSVDDLKEGTYGIFEPDENLPKYDRESGEPAACIIPALVYDKKGYRLGYGKGYYDRYLSSYTGTKVGMIYNDFILDTVPRGRFDLAVDFLVTENGIRVVK